VVGWCCLCGASTTCLTDLVTTGAGERRVTFIYSPTRKSFRDHGANFGDVDHGEV